MVLLGNCMLLLGLYGVARKLAVWLYMRHTWIKGLTCLISTHPSQTSKDDSRLIDGEEGEGDNIQGVTHVISWSLPPEI